MSDLTVRDHSQPCVHGACYEEEHPVYGGERCPGGREIKLMRLADEPSKVWVEVTE